jgi:hypothetical protein
MVVNYRQQAISRLYADMEERREEREEKWEVSLQLAYAQKFCEIDKWHVSRLTIIRVA